MTNRNMPAWVQGVFAFMAVVACLAIMAASASLSGHGPKFDRSAWGNWLPDMTAERTTRFDTATTQALETSGVNPMAGKLVIGLVIVLAFMVVCYSVYSYIVKDKSPLSIQRLMDKVDDLRRAPEGADTDRLTNLLDVAYDNQGTQLGDDALTEAETLLHGDMSVPYRRSLDRQHFQMYKELTGHLPDVQEGEQANQPVNIIESLDSELADYDLRMHELKTFLVWMGMVVALTALALLAIVLLFPPGG